uniref:Uncharacterized protein n=1 Tax=Pseudomonas aeruginosa TaxID=287 RepID=A0A7S6G6E2_PSEAI|nr:hypothetical protein [Pseudomonas aeruginosa]
MAEVSWLGGLDSMWLSSPELMCARTGHFVDARKHEARTVAGSGVTAAS